MISRNGRYMHAVQKETCYNIVKTIVVKEYVGAAAMGTRGEATIYIFACYIGEWV